MNITIPTIAAVSAALILAGCGFGDTEQKYLNATSRFRPLSAPG